MNTISQSEILLQDATNEVGSFLRKYQVADILKQCNGYKQKGFSVIQLFAYLVTLMFQPLSTYMSMRVGAYKEPFSKNTIRRFCNNASINWHKFLRVLSQKLVVEFMRSATSDDREEYEKLIVSKAKEYDGRTLAGKIRKQACMKASELILQMLSQAVTASHTAKYVLFDSWFATPKGIMDIKNLLHMDVIAVVKKPAKSTMSITVSSTTLKKSSPAAKSVGAVRNIFFP